MLSDERPAGRGVAAGVRPLLSRQCGGVLTSVACPLSVSSANSASCPAAPRSQASSRTATAYPGSWRDAPEPIGSRARVCVHPAPCTPRPCDATCSRKAQAESTACRRPILARSVCVPRETGAARGRASMQCGFGSNARPVDSGRPFALDRTRTRSAWLPCSGLDDPTATQPDRRRA
jgi:hypothetical protein